jgi:hypothetical protein
MKNTLLSTKHRTGSLTQVRRPAHLRRPARYTVELPHRTDRSRINWPTDRELQQVSVTLSKVSRTGRQQENAGDYFTSGDLAYQLQEILRATEVLLRKSQRFNS